MVSDKLNLDWEDCQDAVDRLVTKLQEQNFYPHDIIGIAKGGLIPAALVLQQFPNARFHSLRVQSYGPQGKLSKAGFTFARPELSWNEPTTLVVDDIMDWGDTYRLLSQHLFKARFGFMLYRRREGTILPPGVDFGRQIDDDRWVNLPWEWTP